jgi:Rne/Rng family ribonuclease
MKRVLINVEDRELRVAILEDEQLVEFYSESLDERSILNNIYRGRIEGILPGLNAAFVNVGLERNAFLHFEDVRPDVIAAKAGISRKPVREVLEEAAQESVGELDSAEAQARTAELTYAASEEELEAAREIAAEIQNEARDNYAAGQIEPALSPTGIAPASHQSSDEDEEDDAAGERDDRDDGRTDEDGGRRRRRRRGRRGGRRRFDEGAEGRALTGRSEDGEDGDEDDDGQEASERPAPRPRFVADGEETDPEDAELAAELAIEPYERHARRRRNRRGERPEGEERSNEPEIRLFFDPRLAKRMDRRGGRPEDWANHRGYEPPAGYAIDWVIPDDDADAGTRAAVNPFEGVFTAGASLSKRWKIMALKRARHAADGQEVFFGPMRREADDATLEARDTQEAIFGAVRVRYDENGEVIPNNDPQLIGGVKYAGHRSGGSGKFNKFKKKRKRKGRHMKRNDRSFFAVRRKKSDDDTSSVPVEPVVEETPSKPSRARKAKAVEAEPEPVVEAPKPKRPSRAKAKVEEPEPLPEVVEAPKAKRSAKAKAEEPAVPVKEVPTVVAEEPQPETKPAKARPSRSRKATESAVEPEAPAVVPGTVEAATEELPPARPNRSKRKSAPQAESTLEPMAVAQNDFLTADAPAAETPAAESADADADTDDGSGGRRRRRRGRRGGRRHRDGQVGEEESGAEESGETEAPAEAAAPADAGSEPAEGAEGEQRPYKSRRERERERRERRKELRWNRPDKAPVPAGQPAREERAPREERPAREERPGREERRDRKDRPSRDHQAPRAPRQKLPSFIETFSKGDDIMVQVIKEEIGTKGARITTFASLPGRYLVLLPYPNEEGGVSRKVEDMAERRRLKKLLRDISGDDYGFIIRTAGIEKDEEEIKKDAEFLIEEWRAIQASYEKAKATDLVASDQDILYKLCRDVFDESIGEIIIDDADQADHLRGILGRMIPGLVDRIHVHDESENLFVKYGVDKQLAKAARRKVWLKSGGYIIIDEAEALTAIDVNTGKFVGKDDQEKMILKTNLEAARTIARELKLRDIGGLIVVDFIDMKDQRNRDQVQQEFRACLKKDRSKTQVSNISEFGLIEMTRKRVRRSLRKTLFTDCPYCQGAGVILSERQIWLHIKHELIRVLEASQGQTDTLTVTLNPRIKQHIETTYRDSVQRLERRYAARIAFAPTDLMHMENFRFERTVKSGATPRPEDL